MVETSKCAINNSYSWGGGNN